MAFDLEDFVVSKPSQNAPNISVISVDFLREEKTAQNVRPSENRRHAILPSRVVTTPQRMRQAYTFNAVLMYVCWM